MCSTGSTEVINCVIHKEQTTAVCLKHKVLLCTDCLLEKTHDNSDCERKKIKDLESRYECTLVGYLALQQDVVESKDKFQVFINEIKDKGDDIQNKIINFHDELVKKLGEFKDAALDSLKTDVESDICSREVNLSKIKYVEVKVADKINTLQDENLNKANEELKKYKTELSGADKTGEINASFKKSTELETILTVVKDIGKIAFFVEDFYEDIASTTVASTTDASTTVASTPVASTTDASTTVASTPVASTTDASTTVASTTDKQEVYTGSDNYSVQTFKPENNDAPPVPPRLKNEEMNKTESGQVVGCKGSEHETGAKPKEAKKKGGLFSKGSNKNPLPKANKAVELKTLKNQVFSISPEKEGRSFEKMMLFDQDKLVMLDKKQKEVSIVSIEGEELAQFNLKFAPIDFVITGAGKIIVLIKSNDSEVKVLLLEFKEGKLKKKNTNTQKNIKLPVLGIDYKKNKHTDVFAITGNGTVTILEATEGALSCNFKMSNIKTFPPSKGDLSNALAIYDFPTDSVFLLNKERKTMKRFLFDRKDFGWAKRLSGEDIVPKTMTKGMDCLYVACSDFIAMYNDKDGQRHERSGLDLSDTFTNVTGICLEEKDEVAIVVGDTHDGSQLAFVEL